jgi:DNA polymerase-3 subunit epsilon
MKKIYFDTETSGFTPGQIGQLSLIIEDDTQSNPIAKNYFFKIKTLDAGAAEVCGRTLEFYETASNGKVFADYKDEILEDFKDATLIAHNLKFDENFVSTEFWRVGILFKPTDRFDTMNYFKDIVKAVNRYGRPKNPKLEQLVDYFKIDKNKVLQYTKQLFSNCTDTENIGFHDARYDTTSMFVVMKVYQDSLYGRKDWESIFVIK